MSKFQTDGQRWQRSTIVNYQHLSLKFSLIKSQDKCKILNLRHGKHNVNNNKGVVLFLSFCLRLLSLSQKTLCQNKVQKQTGFFSRHFRESFLHRHVRLVRNTPDLISSNERILQEDFKTGGIFVLA